MNNEMIELVARAICESEKMNPDDPLGGWIHWKEAACAAIEAIDNMRAKETKQVGLREFLTSEEINKSVELYTYHRPAFHKRCRDEVIKPVIDRINSSLGQENDPDYLVYAIESVLSRI